MANVPYYVTFNFLSYTTEFSLRNRFCAWTVLFEAFIPVKTQYVLSEWKHFTFSPEEYFKLKLTTRHNINIQNLWRRYLLCSDDHFSFVDFLLSFYPSNCQPTYFYKVEILLILSDFYPMFVLRSLKGIYFFLFVKIKLNLIRELKLKSKGASVMITYCNKKRNRRILPLSCLCTILWLQYMYHICCFQLSPRSVCFAVLRYCNPESTIHIHCQRSLKTQFI